MIVTSVKETPSAAATRIQALWSSSVTTAKGGCWPGGTIWPPDDIVVGVLLGDEGRTVVGIE